MSYLLMNEGVPRYTNGNNSVLALTKILSNYVSLFHTTSNYLRQVGLGRKFFLFSFI